MPTDGLPFLARPRRSRLFHVVVDMRDDEYVFYCGRRVQASMVQEEKPLGSPDVDRCGGCLKSQLLEYRWR